MVCSLYKAGKLERFGMLSIGLILLFTVGIFAKPEGVLFMLLSAIISSPAI